MWGPFCDIYSPNAERLRAEREFRLIIAGSRKFDNYEELKEECDYLLSEKCLTHTITIISGTANGADKLGERYAEDRGFNLVKFPANWNRQKDGSYDKRAGYVRNKQMAEYAIEVEDRGCVVFWDGKSKGTKSMIDLSKNMNIKTATCIFNK